MLRRLRIKNLVQFTFQLKSKPRRTSQRAFRFPNALKKVPSDRLNRLTIAEIRAVIKMMQLRF
jgi:hypothetical protein